MKNKTLAAWLALVLGPIGAHRVYLFGWRDVIAWALLVPTALGLIGVQRARQLGLDDPWSWVLIPLIGLTIAGCALNAIVYGLMTPEKWNTRFNPSAPVDAPTGASHWLTIGAVVVALLIGATALMASLAFGFQRYFEYQVEEARKISQ